MEILSYENLVALLTLTTLEIVLGIDNIVFIAIVVAKLPKEVQARVRRIGLLMAMLMRIMLLLGITWIMKLTTPIFELMGHAVTGKDIILLMGGLFLIGKATREIHEKIEGNEAAELKSQATINAQSVVLQIMLLDIIFSLDSVITAVGMAQSVAIMIVAVIIAVIIMLFFSGQVSSFIEKHPSIKMLALSFLLLIGVMLVAEGTGHHFNRGYIYFAMAFSLIVEFLNIKEKSAK